MEDSHWQPSLFALWVHSVCQVQVGINSSEDFNGDVWAVAQCLNENYLQIAVVIEKAREVVWGALATKFDISLSKGSRLV